MRSVAEVAPQRAPMKLPCKLFFSTQYRSRCNIVRHSWRCGEQLKSKNTSIPLIQPIIAPNNTPEIPRKKRTRNRSRIGDAPTKRTYSVTEKAKIIAAKPCKAPATIPLKKPITPPDPAHHAARINNNFKKFNLRNTFLFSAIAPQTSTSQTSSTRCRVLIAPRRAKE